MSVDDYIRQGPDDQQQLYHRLRNLIEQVDGKTEARMIEMMGAPMLSLAVNGECKYGFSFGRQLSFHFWAMYCTPSIREKYAHTIGVPKSRVKKSCFNMAPGDELEEEQFRAMISASAGYVWPFGDDSS